MKPIDIFIGAYLRPQYTGKTIKYLKERTKYPYRLFLLDNGGNEQFKNEVDYYVGMSKNFGVHGLWNMALALAESEYFITSDNDIYVPALSHGAAKYDGEKATETFSDDWLTRIVKYMDERSDYGAISLHPHVIIGNVSEDPNDLEDVKEVDHAGAVMRIMRTQLIRDIGGWEHVIRPQRNGEEKWISSKIRDAGYKVGRTTRIRAYHPFGNNWGYDESITPEMQGHRPDLKDYVKQFDNPDAYDEKTWLPKI